MTGRHPALVTLFALLFVAPAPSQMAAQGPKGAEGAGPGDGDDVRVRVTAVVRDARGRPVPNLQAGDFTLEDNGVAQTLTSVEYRSTASAAASPAPVLSAEEETRAAREPGTRLFALFLDEFNVAAGEHSARVRDAAGQFLDTELRPADLLFVLKPLGSVTAIRFTRDRAAARAAVAAFAGRKGDYEPRTDFERQFFGRTPAAVEGARAQIVTNALRELTLRIGELQSTRAALVLASEGLARTPGGEGRRLPGWQALARAASHFNLPVYTLDPRDPEPAEAREDTVRPESPAEAPPRPPRDRGLTMSALAEQTGGQAFAGTALTRAFAQISRDLDAYYVLTYAPSAPTDGRFHPIQVRTDREGVVVRTPTGYWSPLSHEWRTWLNRPAMPATVLPTRALRRSPLIDTWYGFETTAEGHLQMILTWEPSALSAQRRTPRPALVGLTAGTAEGGAILEQDVAPAPVTADAGDAGSRAVFTVPAGRLQLDLQITAMDGSVLDTTAQDIDVPALRGANPIILQPQIVRARTAREVRALAQSGAVTPTPARVFRRTERLLLRVPVYSAARAPVTVTARLVNLRGQAIRALEAVPGGAATGTTQFDVPLAFLAPGEYGVEIQAVNAAGSARQLFRFELTG